MFLNFIIKDFHVILQHFSSCLSAYMDNKTNTFSLSFIVSTLTAAADKDAKGYMDRLVRCISIQYRAMWRKRKRRR